MRLAEHGALQKCNHAIRFIIHKKYFHGQIILRQRGQFMLRVLKAAIAGNTYNFACFPGSLYGTGRANGRRKA